MAEGIPACELLYDTSLLLQFCNDDNLSGLSGMEVDDRISYLEQRLQLQEDEIQVLKAALADVLRRLSTCEENGINLSKRRPDKVYQLLRGLPSRPTLSNGAVPHRRGYATSPSSPKRELLPGKSGHSSCPSPERPASLKRESFKDQRSRTTSSSSSCSGKREGGNPSVNGSGQPGETLQVTSKPSGRSWTPPPPPPCTSRLLFFGTCWGRAKAFRSSPSAVLGRALLGLGPFGQRRAHLGPWSRGLSSSGEPRSQPGRGSGEDGSWAPPGRSFPGSGAPRGPGRSRPARASPRLEGAPPARRSQSRAPSMRKAARTESPSKPKEAIFNAEDGYVKMFLRGRPIPMFVPDAVVATYSLDAKLELPHKKLKLDWVYGYRGRDCRANLFLLPTGEIVYFVAAVAVLYNVEEQRQRHYLGHTDDIKCLTVHPDMVTVATGQVAGTSKDGKVLPPQVRIWDSVSLNTLHVLGPGPFDRAVTCVGFSKSNGGGFLCAVDDSNDHVLSVWDWQKEQKLADVKCSNESVLAATFHPTEPTLLITCGKSHIHFWTLEGGSLSKRQGIFEKHEKPKYVLCVAFTENGDTVTGDSGGNLYIWGKGGNRICHAVPGAHEGGIFGLCVLRNGTILTGGGRDRRVVLWGRDYQKLQENEVPDGFGPVRTIAEGKGDSLFVGTTRNSVLHGSLSAGFSLLVQGHTEELWGLATHPTLDQFLTCGQDKQVHLWSVASHQPLWSKGIEDAARSAAFHPSGSVLVVGTVTGRWLVLDTETRDLVAIHTDGGEPISVVSFSPDGKYLALGSHDNFVYIYLVSEGGRKYGRVGKCSGHSSFITHLDWAFDSSCLLTNSGDYEILYWDPSTCRQITSAEAVRNQEWATATCVLGFGVFGIWPEGADGTDINAVCRSHEGKLLASADDFGKVHLFSYPCCQPRAPSHTYSGHSSHVTNIAFLHDDSLLLSTGGVDTSVLQWRLV